MRAAAASRRTEKSGFPNVDRLARSSAIAAKPKR